MFNKVLIANRGEIAVRIIRACRELGIETVAVFSEADRQALHVRLADEAYYLGPAPSRESYLRGEKIIEIAKKSSAKAIHPGYGFLAERADFAQACLDANLAFIGPRPASIEAMGDKAKARATVSNAGVAVVPGTEGEGTLSDGDLLAIAPRIGFPLLIKARAGGGGKGMREVRNLQEMPPLIQAARREAEAFFWGWQCLSGEAGIGGTPYRNPDSGRSRWKYDPPGRKGMFSATPASETGGRVPLAFC